MPKRTVVVVSSDKHSGSTLGLMKPEPFLKHDGDYYTPSNLQKIIWKQYQECLDIIKEERKRSRLIWVENGDPAEGIHHGTTQIASSRVEEHEYIARDVLDYTFQFLKFDRGDLAYMVAGTEEHGGSGSQSENRIAHDIIGFVPRWSEKSGKNHRFVWDRLLLRVNGVLMDIAHHGGSVGSRTWTRENGLRNTLKSFYFQCLNDQVDLPRYWVRSHNHEFVHDAYSDLQGTIEGVVTPSFQFKTGYAYRFAGHRLSDIGLIMIIVDEDGRSQLRPLFMRYKQDSVQEV